MLNRALNQTAWAALVLVFLSGCSSVSSYDPVALNCDDRYTQCAPIVESVKKMAPVSDKTMIEPQNTTQVSSTGAVSNDKVILKAKAASVVIPVIKPMLFDFDQSVTSSAYVRDVARFLMANSTAVVTLHGYTDPIGSERYNRALSYQRADTIRQRLRNAGVSAQQVRVEAHGENNLVVPESRSQTLTRAALIRQYAPNRRVEISFSLLDSAY